MQADVDVTVSTIRAIITNHEAGDFYSSGQLADQIERNSRIRGALDSRIRAVLGSDSILESPQHAADDPLAKLINRQVMGWWHTVATEAVLEGMLRYHITMGFAPAEVTWGVRRTSNNEGTWLPCIHPWHPATSGYDDDSKLIYVIDAKGRPLYVKPGDGRWLLLSASVLYPWMRGVIRCVGIEDTLRGQAVKDWARWCEKHGIPITKVYLPRQEVNSVAGKAFMRQLRLMGRQGHVKLPVEDDGKRPWDVDFSEMKAAGWEGFQKIIGLADTDVSIAILGQNLTSEVTGGSFAAARVHGEVKLDIVKADAGMLATCLREHVIKPWVRFNYGAHLVELAPWPKWLVEPKADRTAKSEVFAKVMAGLEAVARMRTAGLAIPLDIRMLLEEYEIPTLEPTDG